MRLLNSTSLDLVEFFGIEVPAYAILSHTWEKEEVTYQEMRSPTDQTKQKAGFIKVQRAAGLAQSKGYEYIWVDTCCIDKSSSAELTEAINSMYKWYKQSGVCFVFLFDVSIEPEMQTGSFTYRLKRKHSIQESLRSCRWITRGWTLQELIAPKAILFYSSNYNYIGDKHSLAETLSLAAGMNPRVLIICDPSDSSVAERMSWASARKTTRVEDMAYCLMGIFDVNMPLLYGEGDQAFIRLQEEILKSSDDHSLFAWRASVDSKFSYRGLLARSPEEFRQLHNSDFASPSQLYDDHPTLVTNKGIQMTIPLAPWPKVRNTNISSTQAIQKNAFEDENLFVAILNCDDGIGIILVRLGDQNQYARVDANLLLKLSPEGFEFETIRVRQRVRLSPNHYSSRLFAFHIGYTSHFAKYERKLAFASHGKFLEFDQNTRHNIFELCSLDGSDETSKILSFRIETFNGGANNDFAKTSQVSTSEELIEEDEMISKNHKIAKWQELFARNVEVVMKWDSQTGKYGFQALYRRPNEIPGEASRLVSLVEWDCTAQIGLRSDKKIVSKRHMIPESGSVEIGMYTKLIEDHPMIVVNIEEYLRFPR